jgi:hypothetical protein
MIASSWFGEVNNMATNLTREWLKAAQTILKQTGNVQLNPEDEGYAEHLKAIVWKAVRAFRRGYLEFAEEIKSERAKTPSTPPASST